MDKRAATAWNCHQAIANVTADVPYYSPNFLRLKTERAFNPMSFDKILSDREMAVLAFIAVPFSDREIATNLGISSETVEKHRFNMLRKLNRQTTTALVRFARKCGIVRSHSHTFRERSLRTNTPVRRPSLSARA